MKRKLLRSAALVFSLAAAQAETATNIVNGVTSNHSGLFYVGQSGPDNVLIVTNGGRLYVSPGLVSHIGQGDAADRNSATVTGSGSLWQTGYLNLGYEGASNTLAVTNGGAINATAAYVGSETNAHYNVITVVGAGSVLNSEAELVLGDRGLHNRMTISQGGRVSVGEDAFVGKSLVMTDAGWALDGDNRVLVTGSGSLWTVADELFIGHNSLGNELTIADGGEVRDHRGVIGNSTDSERQDNRAIVTGPNSLWINTGPLVVGSHTSRNSLTVTNGGRVVSADGILGEYAPDADDSANGNTALVTGSGSVWSNSASLYVGRAGDSNSVAIRSGGAVSAGGDVYIGYEATAAENRIELGGGSLTLTNSGAGALDVRGGTLVFDGGDVTANRLVMTNNTAGGNQSLFDFHHGTLNTLDGSQIVAPAGSDFVVGNTAGQTAAWNLKGGTNGVQPVAGNAARVVLGGAAGATGVVTVTGAATVWDIDGTLEVRRGTLTLDGGTVEANLLLATNNTAGVTSAVVRLHSGTLNSHGTLIVVPPGQNLNVGDVAGQTVTWNILDGTNGVFAVAGSSAGIQLGSVVGASAGVLVTGSGTVWSNGANLVVGDAGAGSRLTVTDGARVFNSLGLVGNLGTAGSNAVLVTGGDSVWNNSGALVVGNGGTGNALTVSNAGRVVSSSGYIGDDTSASNNTVLVTGSGSVWTNTSDLTLATDGSGNSLIITNGGRVGVAGNDYIGFHYVAHDNTATITGSGSVWNTTGYLAVGYSGFGNQLTIANGGEALARDAYVGLSASASNNAILVTDAGSRMNLATNLHMGYGSAGNTLTVTNGGVLSVGGNAHIGTGAGAQGNTALVTGSGSVWTNAGELLVGSNGVGNALNVVDGGHVGNEVGYIGYAAGARSNSVLVSGSGAVWSNSFGLNIGYSGADNAMIVSNQGAVYSDRSYIGSNAGASNNAVLVVGAGSRWQATSDVRVGSAGAGNTLTITNGGAVYSANGSVGTVAGAHDNAAVIIGSGSVWSNSGTVQVGSGGANNRLTIAAGGAVYNDRSGIGWSAGASNNTVQVTGLGSVWNNSSYMYIGNLGGGSRLTIEDGGKVWVQSAVLGVGSGSSNNTLNLAGGGSFIATNAGAGSLEIRRGTLTLQGGGVNINSFLATNGASSVVSFSGGTLRSGGSTVANGAAFVVGDGTQAATLDLNGGTHSFADGLAISSNATLTGTGALVAPLTLQSGATLTPGHSPGLLTISNDLTLASGSTLQMELAGYTAGSAYDQLIVTGLLTNDSALLSVSMLDGFAPTNGAQFVIMDLATSGYGAFSGAPEGSTNAFGSSQPFTITYLGGADSHDIILTAIPEPGSVALVLLFGGALVAWRRLRRWR